MKKNFLFSVMALCMLLFAASCSQEEILSADNQAGGSVSLSVNIPVNNPVTRAIPTIPNGYKLRCILQLVNASNVDIPNGRFVEEVVTGSEKVTFTFDTPSEAYKCLLWADYVKVDGDITTATDNIYTTTDLKAIGYTENAGAEMFNNDAADAFYGYSLEASTAKAQNITLKRPFTRITFASSDEAYKDYTKIAINNLPAPKGFNVMTGATDGNDEIASSDLEIKEGRWFSAYLFVGNNTANLGKDNDIMFTLKKADNTETALKFAGESITLTQNNDVIANVTPSTDNKTEVTVTFPGDMENPNTPKPMAVGDYINKDGSYSKTFDAAKAIAIVWKVVTDGGISVKDETNKYTIDKPVLANKTIVGYAYAINSVSRGKAIELTALTPTNDSPWDIDYNGYSYSAVLIEKLIALGSKGWPIEYNKWNTEADKMVAADNLSNWYIPSASQLFDMTSFTFGYQGDKHSAVEKNTNLYDAFKTAVKDLEGAQKCFNGLDATNPGNILSCNIKDAISLVSVQLTGEVISDLPAAKGQNAASVRPVLTIFK